MEKEYLPKQMSNAAENTIYFTDKILITPAILQAAGFQEDYKNVFTTLALFKKLMNFIEDNYDMLQMSTSTTYTSSEKYDNNTQSLINEFIAEYKQEQEQQLKNPKKQEIKEEPIQVKKEESIKERKKDDDEEEEDDDEDDDEEEEEEDEEDDEDEDFLDANLDESTKKFIKNMYNLKKNL